MSNLEKLINDAKEVIAYEVLTDGEQVYLSSKGEDKLSGIITQAYNKGKEDILVDIYKELQNTPIEEDKGGYWMKSKVIRLINNHLSLIKKD